MRVLRSMSLGVFVALGVFLGFGLLTPRSYQIKQSINIKSSGKVTFNFIKDLSQWNNWAFDSIMLYQDESKESVYYWNDQSGKGEIAIKSSVENEQIVIDISMVDGAFKSESVFSILEAQDDSISVTWQDTQDLGYNFIARYYALFSDFEVNVSENYQQGLQKLKTALENGESFNIYSQLSEIALEDTVIDKWQNTDLIIDKIGDLNDKSLAEIGAKGGYFSFKFINKAKQVISLETHKNLYEKLKERTRVSDLDNIEVRLTGVISPAIYEEEVDVVLMTHFWAELSQPYTYLQRIKRGIKKDGKLVILEFIGNIPEGYPTQVSLIASEIKQTIENAGFTNVTTTELGNGQYMYIATAP